MFDQRLFGLHVRSDRPLPFAPAVPPAAPDITVETGISPNSRPEDLEPWTPSADAQFHTVYASRTGSWYLDYHDGTTIEVDRNAVRLGWREPLTFEDACTYLAGAPFALLLRMRGAVCLHGSAVTLGHQTVAFVGPSGAGKSTTAAALLERGAELVTDDLLAIVMRHGQPHVLPSYSGVRLWPDAVSILRGDSGALPRITEGWEKRILESPVADDARRLDRICILGDGSRENDAGMVMTLIANSYRPDLTIPAWRRTEFDVVTSLAELLPLTHMTAHAPVEQIVAYVEGARV